jgi:hypothetical protein
MLNRYLYMWCLLFISMMPVATQTPGLEKAIQVQSTVQPSVPRINLTWVGPAGGTSWKIYRKLKDQDSWGAPLVSGLPSTVHSWADSTAEKNIAYEYRIQQIGSSAWGYILSGFEIPPVDDMGILILVLDTTELPAYINELEVWKSDLRYEGWRLKQISVSQTDSVGSIKERIKTSYNQNPEETKAILLFGHVPVPYSGNFNPDGHADHAGAWPCDGYYAELNGTWKDVAVNTVSAAQTRNRNIPGDGKFDQTTFPSALELQIGRVDMYDLPSLGNEGLLLKKYLIKDRLFRTGKQHIKNQAVIDDNFSVNNPEGFSASSWRGFSAICGKDSIFSSDYFSNMRNDSYLWSHGCGFGNYTGASGIGSSNDFGVDSVKGIFTMMFGSYFADWDNTNNFLRAAIAGGSILTNVWSGRPYWHFHQTALGESMGFSALKTMNNQNTYDNNSFPRGVHMAFIGDPTLKAFPTQQPSNFRANMVNEEAILSWNPAPGFVNGYHVYRLDSASGRYLRINQHPITGNTFTDTCLSENGIVSYLVRALKLERTPSGSFFSLSTGLEDTLISAGKTPLIASYSSTTSSLDVSFSASLSTANSWFWDFGDHSTGQGSETNHNYTLPGSYLVKLVAENSCEKDSISLIISVFDTGIDQPLAESIKLFPNPAHQYVRIKHAFPGRVLVSVSNLNGAVILQQPLNANGLLVLNDLNPGIYLLTIGPENKPGITRKLVIY